MNVLSMGMPFGTTHVPLSLFRSLCGHDVRVLAAAGTEEVTLDSAGVPFVERVDYAFGADETAAEVIARISADWAPDLLICWMPEMFPPPRAIEHCPIKTAAIVSDWNIYYPQIEYNMARYDVVVTDKLGSEVLELRGAKARYLFPLYSHRSPLHRKIDVAKDIDVAFLGNLNHAIHHERARYLELAASLSDRYRVVIGSGVYGEEYVRLFNRTRIVLNCALRREMNLRCFEAIACNALLFIGEDNLETPDCLEDREDVVMYREDNLVELLEHYLSHPEKTARITRQGNAKAADLAGEKRMDALITWLGEQPMGPRAFRDFPAEDQALAGIMQYASSLVTVQAMSNAEPLTRAARQFPDRPEFLVALGSDMLAKMSMLTEEQRKALGNDVATWFKGACGMREDSAALWLNLAFLCRNSSAESSEAGCLEFALRAGSCDYGGQLLGRFSDPYYARWRRALAFREQRVEMLWAAAAARLAELRLDQQRYEEACDLATRSLGWMPDVAEPYRVRAVAESQLGDLARAADTLAEGLPFTAFDADYRLDLVAAWQALGKIREARELALESVRIFAACPGEKASVEAFHSAAETL